MSTDRRRMRPTDDNVWRSIRRAARIVWAERAGRTAVMAVLIGTVGLTTHHWTALPMLAVLRLPRLSRLGWARS